MKQQAARFSFEQVGGKVVAYMDGKRVCTKTPYYTEDVARTWIKRIARRAKKNHQKHKVPIRAYLCDCGMWHLTSKEKY